MTLKRAWIVDFCWKSSRFVDFENTVYRRSAVNLMRIFDSACLDVPILVPKQNLDHRSFIDLSLALVSMLMSASKLFRFSNEAHLNSSVSLLLELCCVIVIKHVAFFTICAKLTLAFTLTFLFPDVIEVLDLSKNIGGSTDLVKKKAQIGRISYPYSTPSLKHSAPSCDSFSRHGEWKNIW